MILHADAIAQNCAARKRTARVDGENPDCLSLLPDRFSKLIDQRALPRPRWPRYPNDLCATRMPKQSSTQLATSGGLRFDQCRGTCNRPQVARHDAL